MDPRQRFKSDHPCPVCGGHPGLPQGEGSRCYGFISEDGLYAYCTREEHAGDLNRNGNSNTYAHYLKGDCQCGEVHGVGPAQARPLPGGSHGAPSVHSYRHPELGRPDQLWAYRYAHGALAGYAARWNKSDGDKEFRPLVLENGRWLPKGIPKPRPIYNLLELLKRPDAPVLVVEGEKTSDTAGKLYPSHISITSMGGAKAPRQSDWGPLKDRQVVVWPDNDSDGQRYAQEVTDLVLKAGASRARIVQLPEGMPAKWDLADPIPDGVDVERLLANAEPVVAGVGKLDADGEGEGQGHSLSSGDRLLKWANETAGLYCDGEEAYADVWIDGHRETLPVRSKGFRRWLRQLYWERTGRGVTREALTHAEENLDAKAARAGQRRVYLRTATHEGKLYIDLGDDSWRVVEIDSEGWRVLSDPSAVRFRRPKTAGPLPEPVGWDAMEGLSALRRFLNIDEGDFVLCVSWLLASLRDTGPYPLLVLTGDEGGAKSTMVRLLRSLVDPGRPQTTGMPRNERDAAIAARTRHVLAYDNLSGLPTWLSDTLCRLSTGEGFVTRALHTDYEEVVMEASRPVILTGIENPSVRGDLADRSIIIRLSRIDDSVRRTESELMEAFEEVRPRIFGALLSGLSEGLRKEGSVQFERLPRMADFCEWAVACEGVYWPPGTFMAAYDDARASATENVLEDSPIGPALRQFLEEEAGSFEGTATEFLNRLGAHQKDEKTPRTWPSTGAVMGKQLTRLAPSLRKLGYTAELRRTKQGNSWLLEAPRQAAGLPEATMVGVSPCERDCPTAIAAGGSGSSRAPQISGYIDPLPHCVDSAGTRNPRGRWQGQDVEKG